MNPLELKPRKELLHGLRFEGLISGLLARFWITSDARLDLEITNAIQRLVEVLGLDQGILVQWREDANLPVPTHSWTAPGCRPVQVATGLEDVAWVHSESLAGKTVTFSNVKDLPPAAEKDKAFFLKGGIKGLISLPLIVGDRVIGTLVLTNHHGRTSWSEGTVSQLRLLAHIFAGAVERKRTKVELEEQVQFETLVAALSARFINSPADQVDGWLEDAQRRFCETLGLDRSSLFTHFEQEPGALLLTHIYHNEESSRRWSSLEKRTEPRLSAKVYWVRLEGIEPPTHKRVDAKELFPWVYEQLRQDKTVVISRMEEIPQKGAADREMFRRIGTQSTVVVPLFTAGTWLGCLSFAMVGQPRRWPEALVKRFQFVAHIFANVLARKRAEQALRESEHHLAMASEAGGAGLWSMHVDSNLMWLTPKMRELLQFGPEEELTFERFAQAVHPDDRELLLHSARQAWEAGAEMRLEHRVVLPDGTMRWISGRGRRYCDETGKPDRLTGASVDITGRKLAEESLKQNEERLRLVLEANSEGVWDWNIQSGQAYFSPRYSEMLDYTTEEFAKDYSSWKALVHPDDFERVHRAHMQHIRKGQEFCVEFRMRKKTGDWCWIRSQGMIVERDSKGGALRMVGTHLDITARKQAEDRAQESEGRFLLMANSAPVLIWAAGPDKLCTFFNEPWLKFTGRTLEQELGEGWAAGVHPDDRDGCLKVYTQSFDARRPFTIEYRLRRSDGQYRWVSDHGVARYDSAQNFAGYIGSVVDVTERKQAEAEAQRARQELAHAGRVTTLGELAGSLAHELSQPLTAILSNAQAAQQILRTAAPDLNETRLILEDIIAQERHAGGVILRMRAMLKKGRAQLVPLDMNALVREVLGLIRSELLVRNVTVITDLAPHLPLVRGDRVQLQQVVLNLVMNACDALKIKPGSNHAVTVQAKRLDVGQVQVAVSDRGPGFSAEMLERPFEPFRTTKPHGLGLGLPICRSIIGAHNGRLWLANNGDGGATVSFELPVHQKETP